MNYYGATAPEISEREIRNAAIARRAAAESFVLLQNPNDILPLKAEKIALYGMGARRTVVGGEGSGECNPRYKVSVEQGLENAGYTVTSKAWLNDYDREYAETYEEFRQMVESKLVGMTNPAQIISTAHSYKYRYPSGRLVNETDVASSDTNTAIYVLMRQAGECTDRKPDKGDFQLTDIEVENLNFLTAHYAHVTLVINVGGLIDLTPVADLPIAIVFMVQGGSEGGNALADVLSGKVNFCGRLADSWPMNYAQIPGGENFSSLNDDLENEYYTEGRFIGYRYFDTFGVAPRFPFGFGLSYTTFAQTVADVALDGKVLTVRVQVTNTGSVPGREVVQAYLGVPGSVAQSLAVFVKTPVLAAGESCTAELKIDLADNAIYNEASACWQLPQGEYRLYIGKNSRDTVIAAVLALAETVTVKQCRTCCAASDVLQEIEATAHTLPPLPETAVQLVIDPAAFACETADYTEPQAAESPRVREVLDSLTTEQQVELLRGGDLQNKTIQHFQIAGAGGKTAITLLEQGVPNVIFSDGPAGVNIVNEIIVTADGNTKPAQMLERYNWGMMRQFAKRLCGDEGQHVYRYATAWPVEMLLAQSWDTALLEEVGAAVADELTEFGITLLLAPAMNIHRNPLCGRNFEYYSEDPLITGKMAAAYVRGMQSKPGVGATIKHFCCNNQEDNRFGVNENVSERALREIYLRGFEIAVKESNPLALMTSYNQLNGAYTGCRRDLITDILRCEWGYTGLVMTDWGTKYDPVAALHAQVDMMMPGCDADRDAVLAGLADGSITPAEVRRAAARVLTLIEQSLTAML